jgi:transcription elongation GreA/GreB family factor
MRHGIRLIVVHDEQPDEADPARGTISYVSPVAQALLGKQVGETVRIGRSDIELVAII